MESISVDHTKETQAKVNSHFIAKLMDPNQNHPSILKRFCTSYGAMTSVCAFLESCEVIRLQQLSRWQYHVNIPRVMQIHRGIVVPYSLQTNLVFRINGDILKYDTNTRKVVSCQPFIVFPNCLIVDTRLCKTEDGSEYFLLN